MNYILGLDVSTSIVGYTVLNNDQVVIEIDHIDLRKIKDLWEKADFVRNRLKDIIAKHNIKRVYIEESLQVFRSGFSSAHTLSTLSKFNGLVFYFTRECTGIKPTYVSASSARKLCGIKIKKGMKAKLQAFEWVTQELGLEWPITRNGNIQQYCYDRSDSYVIARAGHVLQAKIDSDESIK